MKGTVVALGTFDGVHLGHQRIIKDTVNYARRCGLVPVATTFDPHPQQYIVPERGLKLLTTLAERRELLIGLGIKKVKVLKFNEALRRLSYLSFVKKYLVDGLKAKAVFVGFDYAFGHGRAGNVAELRRLGRKFGFKVKMVRPVKAHRVAIKSSLIRELVARGDFDRGLRYLGHPYRLNGKVVKGDGRGRTLGFPTANLKLDLHKLIPQHGVYAGRALGRRCVVNIGARPTFGADGVAIEAHIPGYSGNLYGRTVAIDLIKKIRDEIHFPDVRELKVRILKDIAISKKIML
ncbi:MAG TPA: bifunctional riboflavin kinase/FAD synthetase [Candidatus Omnitrophota bacterium]|nr:bifunctional riboflavin kinase/FAD synthetase [Candidatus Omnitrophota bacterium]